MHACMHGDFRVCKVAGRLETMATGPPLVNMHKEEQMLVKFEKVRSLRPARCVHVTA